MPGCRSLQVTPPGLLLEPHSLTVDGVPHLQLTDRVLIFAERHLRRVLAKYAAHDNRQRPHRALQLRQPRPESPMPEPFHGKVRRRQVLGGLMNEYKPAA
jgi:hypothetical protein